MSRSRNAYRNEKGTVLARAPARAPRPVPNPYRAKPGPLEASYAANGTGQGNNDLDQELLTAFADTQPDETD